MCPEESSRGSSMSIFEPDERLMGTSLNEIASEMEGDAFWLR